MTHSYLGHDSFIFGTWLIHMWDITYSYVGHDSFVSRPWLIRMWDNVHTSAPSVFDSFTFKTWPIHIWDMTHSHLRHDPFTFGTWPIHIVGHYLAIHGTWLIRMWDMTHSYVRQCRQLWESSWLLFWFPDAYLSIWPLTKILFRTIPKTAIFIDSMCSTKLFHRF